MGLQTMFFEDDTLQLIDQRKLPREKKYFQARSTHDVVKAIRTMVVRGAPAIGAAAAYGMVLALMKDAGNHHDQRLLNLKRAAEELKASRPTAVNLSWAVERMLQKAFSYEGDDLQGLKKTLVKEAGRIVEEDLRSNRDLARYGNSLVPDPCCILTHCNAGALATTGYGTALGVIREAFRAGKRIHVYADETRPRLQGARLTAFELHEEGIPCTLIADSVSATLIRDQEIDLVVVGADRIAANGDTANKIGTYMLSELASVHRVPFYVAAPLSTVDYQTPSGRDIPIEERNGEEVTTIAGMRIAPEGIAAYNPAFDCTPAENITAIITDKGVVRPPFEKGLEALR